MSTVDPIEERRRRETARLGSAGAAAGIAIALVLIGAGAVAESRAMFAFGEFDQSGETAEPPLAIFGLVIGVPLTLLGFFVHVGAARRFTGRLMSAPGVSPGVILIAGLALGSAWGVLALPAPGMLWLIPAGLAVLALLAFAAGVRGRIRRRAQASVLDQLVLSGRIVTGDVVEIAEIDASSGGLIGPITVRFGDAAGVDRWVTKTGQWKRADLPANGDQVGVLFDAAAPGDQSRIWVAPLGSRSAADFRRWHA